MLSLPTWLLVFCLHCFLGDCVFGSPSSGVPLSSSLMPPGVVVEVGGGCPDNLIKPSSLASAVSLVLRARPSRCSASPPDRMLTLPSEEGILLLSKGSDWLIDWWLTEVIFSTRCSEFLWELWRHSVYCSSPFRVGLLFYRGNHRNRTGRILAVACWSPPPASTTGKHFQNALWFSMQAPSRVPVGKSCQGVWNVPPMAPEALFSYTSP